MADKHVPHPMIASTQEWLTARKALLAREKEVTRARDALSAQRRRLPMVKIEKDYVFDGSDGKRRFIDLFDGCRQLIVYHFMFDPSWDQGCQGCTGLVDAFGDLSMLRDRDTSLVLISRAPLAKLRAFQARKGWDLPWVSSFGSDFNYDFHVTQDEKIAAVCYNYQDKATLEAKGEHYFVQGENHGLSVFFRLDDAVFHTYSTFARGCEGLTNAYSLLDVTPYGRQEDWEDSPAGWPQRPTYGQPSEAA